MSDGVKKLLVRQIAPRIALSLRAPDSLRHDACYTPAVCTTLERHHAPLRLLFTRLAELHSPARLVSLRAWRTLMRGTLGCLAPAPRPPSTAVNNAAADDSADASADGVGVGEDGTEGAGQAGQRAVETPIPATPSMLTNPADFDLSRCFLLSAPCVIDGARCA